MSDVQRITKGAEVRFGNIYFVQTPPNGKLKGPRPLWWRARITRIGGSPHFHKLERFLLDYDNVFFVSESKSVIALRQNIIRHCFQTEFYGSVGYTRDKGEEGCCPGCKDICPCKI